MHVDPIIPSSNPFLGDKRTTQTTKIRFVGWYSPTAGEWSHDGLKI